MKDFVSIVGWVIVFFLSLIAIFFLCKIILLKEPACKCFGCGWRGEQDDVDSYTTEEEKVWFHFCPKCGSSKVIFTPKKEAA